MREIQEPTKYDYSPLMSKIGRQDCMIHYSKTFVSDLREIFEANGVSFDDAYYPLLSDITLYGIILGRQYEQRHHMSMMRDKMSQKGQKRAINETER